MVEVHQAFKSVARATYATATRLKDPVQLHRIPGDTRKSGQ